MAQKISRIQSVGYVSTRVEPVRAYTQAEKEAILANIEKQQEERAEINKYLAQFPNPEHKSFQELLDELMNPQDEDVIVDIKSWK